jgi:hypothetical protein
VMTVVLHLSSSMILIVASLVLPISLMSDQQYLPEKRILMILLWGVECVFRLRC